MDLPLERLLITNGIVRSTNRTKLYCIICKNDTNYATLRKHVASPSHLQHLQWFRLIFQPSGNNVICEICNTVVDQDDLKLHVESHTIIPWSKADDNYDKYKIFFENQIFQWKNSFHCYPCATAFSSWEFALIHITDPKHQCLYKKTPPMDNYLSRIAVTWEFVVREGLISFSNTALQCTICGCKSVALSSIDRHVKGLVHLSHKLNCQLKLRDCEADDSVTNVITENSQLKLRDCETSDSVSNVVIENSKSKIPDCAQVETITSIRDIKVEDIDEQGRSVLNYIHKQNDSNFYCVICDCELSKRAASIHAIEMAHVIALKHYGCDAITLKNNVDYHCGYCDCTISSLQNVYQHVKGRKHLNSLKVTDEQGIETVEKVAVAKKSTVLPELPVRQYFPCNYLVRLNGKDMHCKVCNCIISAAAINQEIHLTGNFHAKSLNKYGCDGISFRGGNIYHCEYCDVVILDLENVYVHIKEASHMNLLTAKHKRVSLTAMKIPGKGKVPEEASDVLGLACPSLSCNYVTHKTTGSYCEICDIDLSYGYLPVARHVAGRNHADAQKKYGCDNISLKGDHYYCVCCKCDIHGCQNIYKHVKGRKHLLYNCTQLGKLQLKIV